jgi:hypothetical protein
MAGLIVVAAPVVAEWLAESRCGSPKRVLGSLTTR